MAKSFPWFHPNQAEALLIGIPPILSRAIGFFLLPIYTRVLSPSEFGLVSVALVISGIIRLVVLPGIDAVYARYGYNDYGSPNAIPSALYGTIVRLHLSLIFIVLPFIALPGIYLASRVAPDVPVAFFAIAIGSVAFGSLQAPAIARFTARRQIKHVAVRELAMAALIAVTSIVLLLGLKLGAVSLLLGDLCASLLMLPVGFKEVWTGLSKKHPWHKKSLVTVLKSMASIGPEALMLWALTSVDRFVLNALEGPAETGLYVAGYQVGSMVMAFIIIAARQWRMILYRLYLQDKNLNRVPARRIYRGSFELFLAIAGLLSVLSQPIAYFFLGPKFQLSHRIIPIAVLIAFLRVPMTFVSIYCWTHELRRVPALINFRALVIFLISLAILVPSYGAPGAAWSGVFAMLSFVVGLQCLQTDEFSLKTDLVSFPVLFSTAALLVGLLGGLQGSDQATLKWALGAGSFAITVWQARKYFLMLASV